MEYVSHPFRQDLNAYTISQIISVVFSLERRAFELEMLALKIDAFLEALAKEDDFWRVVGQNYCNIKKCTEYIHSCFGSTYLCESAFSFMNAIKTKQRKLLNDSHLSDCLKLSLTRHMPDNRKLENNIMPQISH